MEPVGIATPRQARLIYLVMAHCYVPTSFLMVQSATELVVSIKFDTRYVLYGELFVYFECYALYDAECTVDVIDIFPFFTLLP